MRDEPLRFCRSEGADAGWLEPLQQQQCLSPRSFPAFRLAVCCGVACFVFGRVCSRWTDTSDELPAANMFKYALLSASLLQNPHSTRILGRTACLIHIFSFALVLLYDAVKVSIIRLHHFELDLLLKLLIRQTRH